MLTLSFLGCGRAGQVLGHLWHRQGIFKIGQVLTRSRRSAEIATERIGGGTALGSVADLAPADVLLIATPDQMIRQVAAALADHQGTVFHLAGAYTSNLLRDAGIHGPVASIHPAHSFGNFAISIQQFRGTWCACEGDGAALEVLEPAFRVIGGRLFPIDADQKLIYHAAGVMISNYLNALVATGLETYAQAGLNKDVASSLITAVLPSIIENIITHGPAATLTGPIARGDWQLVKQELEALQNLDPELAGVYRLMGVQTLRLARSANDAETAVLDKVDAVLNQHDD